MFFSWTAASAAPQGGGVELERGARGLAGWLRVGGQTGHTPVRERDQLVLLFRI